MREREKEREGEMMGERYTGTGNKRHVGQWRRRRKRGVQKNIMSGYHCLKDIMARLLRKITTALHLK